MTSCFHRMELYQFNKSESMKETEMHVRKTGMHLCIVLQFRARYQNMQIDLTTSVSFHIKTSVRIIEKTQKYQID